MEEGYTVLELNAIKHVACFFSILRAPEASVSSHKSC